MVKLYILTAWFPFRKAGESFLIPELNYLYSRKEFDVTVIAVNAIAKYIPEQFVPEGFKVKPLFHERFLLSNKLIYLFRMIVRTDFWDEVLTLISKKLLRLKNLRKLISFYCRSLRIADAMKQQINSENDKIVLYSYWMTDSALGASFLRRSPNVIAVTRAHGGDLYEDRNNGYLPMRKAIIENTDLVAPISNVGKNYLIDRNGNYAHIKMFHLGVDNPYGQRNIKEYDKFRIVSCSYMIPLKRVKMIAEAIIKLDSERIEWVHFGDGQDYDDISSLIKRVQTKSKCVLMGAKQHDEIIEYYHNNDVHLFVNVSTSEGVPVSIIEAMSFGIPVIATDVGGTKELVIDDCTGCLIPVEINAGDLASNIEAFMNFNQKKQNMYRQNAFKMWKENYNFETNYKRFYDEILNIF